ncbi:superfamily I DNA/RNA helicase, partial [mine drainage metagenome]
MFDPDSDPSGQFSSRLLSEVTAVVGKARDRFALATSTLIESSRVPADDVLHLEIEARTYLASELVSDDIANAMERAARLERAVKAFREAAGETGAPYGPIVKSAADDFLDRTARLASYRLAQLPINLIILRAAAVKASGSRLSNALSRVEAIAARWELPFDSSPGSVAALVDPGAVAGLAAGVSIDETVLATARRLAQFPLAAKPLEELSAIRGRLAAETTVCMEALAQCRAAIESLGVPFDDSERSVVAAGILAKVAADAPTDLFEYRKASFG